MNKKILSAHYMGRTVIFLFMLFFVCHASGRQNCLLKHPRLLFTEAGYAFDEAKGNIMLRTGSDTSAVTPFAIDHGPYLQEVTADGATFAFNTSAPAFSVVELRKEGGTVSSWYTRSEHGLKAANITFFSVRADDLQPNTAYQYRIHAREMKSFQPYRVTFGDSTVSPWYTFRTVDPGQKGGAIFITSDMHSRPDLLKKLLKLCDYKTCTAFFYAGDMMNYMKQGENILLPHLSMLVWRCLLRLFPLNWCVVIMRRGGIWPVFFPLFSLNGMAKFMVLIHWVTLW